MNRTSRSVSEPPAGFDAVELLDVIGAGAYSIVYRGRFDGRDVAVKVGRMPDPLRSESVRRAFLAEATARARGTRGSWACSRRESIAKGNRSPAEF